MKISETILNFLNDKKYFINIYDNKIYMVNFEKIIDINDNIINIKYDTFTIRIKGKNISVETLKNKEILLNCIIDSMGFSYEK